MASVTATNSDSEEEIQLHHDIHTTESQRLVEEVQAHARKPGCRKLFCKGVILSVAGVLFILMMVQLWSDYGEFITTQAFPPKMISMASYCKSNFTTEAASYNPMSCERDSNDDLVCQTEKPEKAFVDACPHSTIKWIENTLVVKPYEDRGCIDLVVWSI